MCPPVEPREQITAAAFSRSERKCADTDGTVLVGSLVWPFPMLKYKYAANIHTYYYQYSITPSLFYSRLKTFLLCKSFPA